MSILYTIPIDSGEIEDYELRDYPGRRLGLGIRTWRREYEILFEGVCAYRVVHTPAMPLSLMQHGILCVYEQDHPAWASDLAIENRMPERYDRTPVRYFGICLPEDPCYEIIAASFSVEERPIDSKID